MNELLFAQLATHTLFLRSLVLETIAKCWAFMLKGWLLFLMLAKEHLFKLKVERLLAEAVLVIEHLDERVDLSPDIGDWFVHFRGEEQMVLAAMLLEHLHEQFPIHVRPLRHWLFFWLFIHRRRSSSVVRDSA